MQIKLGSPGNDAQLCGIGEMWGYAMGFLSQKEKFDPANLKGNYPGNVPSGWIKPHVFWALVRDAVLTKKQIFDCLTADVDTYDKLVTKMYSKYPNKADAIETAFITHNITPNVPKPDPNPDEIIYDAFYSNRTTSASYTFSGNNILSQNVTVKKNPTLTLRGVKSVTIKPSFVANTGSKFIMALQ